MASSRNRLIRPSEVAEAAKRKEKENVRFRSFLKRNADPDELDRQFLALHREIFPLYNCAKCRNCCKQMHAEFTDDELAPAAKKLGMTREELIAAHLKRDCGEWFETHQPCGFLEKDGRCRLGEARPDSCKGFPFTDRTKRLYSLYSFLSAVSVCPVAYEICERLKQLYGFGSYRKRRRSTEDSIEQAPGFSFVAGYTSWGFPYGVPEEPEEDHAPESDEELPF